MSALGGLGISTVSEYLKTYYLPNGLYNEITLDSELLTELKTKGEQIPITGKTSNFAIEYSRQSGIKISSETGDLPDVNPRNHIQPEVIARQIYGRTSVDIFTIATTKNDAGAFLSALTNRFETLIEDLSNGVQLSAWTNKYAVLGLVTATEGGAGAIASVTNIDRFEEGIAVQIYDDTAGDEIPTGSSKKSLIVVAFDLDTNVVTFDQADYTFLDGDVIVFNIESIGIDTEGLDSQMANATELPTLHNINRTVAKNKFYIASRMKNIATGEAVLDEEVLRKAKSRSQRLTPKKRPALDRKIFAGIREADGYESTVTSERRYPVTGTAPGYETGKSRENLLFDNIEIQKDKYATGQRAYVLSCASFNMHVLEDESWMDQDGSILSRIANKPGYEGANYMFWNMSNKNLRENVLITDVEAYDPSAA